ncbi:MAG: VWA domain-containing protein, partial [Chlorobi bacterium]|nr:VWA domain-containing protein [Chlorobiota bacterium]
MMNHPFLFNENRIPMIAVLGMFALVLLSSTPLSAQPVLEINRVNSFNFPEVRVFFSVTCNGVPRYDLKKENITLIENGQIITDFDIICPDPNGTCCMSVALVFDRSSSMTPQKMLQSKTAGKAFVDLMDDQCDQATVVSFSSDVSVDMSMTSDKLALKGAIDGLTPNGMTAMWDGAGKGLEEVVKKGMNPCKAVILLTDGQENSSTIYDFLQVIALAKANNIRVFTIGLGSDADEYPLQLLAQETGGKYYSSPTGDDLEAIYKDIHTTISHRFLECEIIYRSDCPDGTERTIELTVGLPESLAGCPGYDTKITTYKTPRDPSQFKPVRLSLGKVTVVRGENVDVPLTLEDDVNDIFNTAEFKVLFDGGCCRFLGITTDGYLLDGVTIEWYAIPGGIQFRILSPKPINGKGVLAMLRFTAFDRDCDLYIQDWIFARGCLKPVLQAGKLIIAKLPEVNCSLKIPVPPVWDPATTQYSPDPFEVRLELFNYGNLEAKNVQVTLIVDPRDFELIKPRSTSQPGNPVNIAADGGRSVASWLLSVRKRNKGDSVRICMEARFDNHLPLQCCKKIWIPPTGPILECLLNAPEIKVNTATFRYEPMPFTLDLVVRNEGGEKTDDVYATVNLVPDLRLVAEPGNQPIKKLFPAQLKPGEQGRASWRITHPASPDLKTYKIEVWVRTKGADSTKCEIEITIPTMPG